MCWLGKTGALCGVCVVLLLLSVTAGLCEVEHTEKGWFIKYIDRSPEAMEREAVSYCIRYLCF